MDPLLLLLILLMVPLISFLLAQLVFTKIISKTVFKISCIVIATLFGIVFFTPLSFVGVFADMILFFLFLTILGAWLFIKKECSTRSLLITYVAVIIMVFLIEVSSFFSQAGHKDYISYIETKKVTIDSNYTLIHRVINSNFVYPGTHIIVINKRINCCPLIERRVGEADLGRYYSYLMLSPITYKVDEKNMKIWVHWSDSLDTLIHIK